MKEVNLLDLNPPKKVSDGEGGPYYRESDILE